MIIRQANNKFIALLLALIGLLATACMNDTNGNSGTSPTEGVTEGLTPGPTTLSTPRSTIDYHPSIRIAPERGKAGTEVTIIGGDFEPGSEVQIRITGQETGAPNEYMTKTLAQQHGTIQASFIMPERWPSGELITLPEITVLASTPDFSDKATDVFTFDTNVIPKATP